MSEYIKVQPDEPTTFEAIQINTLEDFRTALAPQSSLEEVSHFQRDFERVKSMWMVVSSDGTYFWVQETDFAADWSKVEDNPIAHLEKEFAAPQLSDEMKERGEFQTEEQWQCFEPFPEHNLPAQWWDATSEANALERSRAAGFPGKVRVRTQTIVTGPWRESAQK